MVVTKASNIWNNLQKKWKYVYPLIMTYLLWWFLHYISVHLYVRYCVPLSFIGFFYSPIITQLPHCYALRWFIDKGGIK